MLSETNNRGTGRFIKKSDPIKQHMSISDFNLTEIMDKPVAYHDNANANIIHRKLHSDEDIAEGIRNSFEINMSFPHESRPVIRPLDFTEEWKKQKKRMATRSHKNDDDDEFELDVTSMLKDKNFDFKKATYTLISSPEKIESDNETLNKTHSSTTVNLFPEATFVSKDDNSDKKVESPQNHSEAPTSQNSNPNDSKEFMPYYIAAAGEKSSQPHRPENMQINEKEQANLREEASAIGYQQGFQLGEEKGTMAAQDKVIAITRELNLIMENLQGMQKSILNNVQENFMLICQSFIESLLHREFKINPEAFSAVIERAISDAMPDDEFIIFVSSKAFQDLGTWSDVEMRKRLKIDERLKDDQFRVEGKHAVIDGDLPKIIRSLLEQADIQLFDKDKQDKVG